MSWKYVLGEDGSPHWEKWTGPLDKEYYEGDEEWEAFLARQGYYGTPSISYGDEMTGTIDIYTPQHGWGELPYTLDIDFNGYVGEALIYIYDPRSLVDFLTRYSTPFILHDIRDDLRRLVEIVRKMFRAWHGHDADEVCLSCDPDLWKRRQEWNPMKALRHAGVFNPPAHGSSEGKRP